MDDPIVRDQGTTTAICHYLLGVGKMVGGPLTACAIRYPTVCKRYLPINYTQSTLEHENKHCEGWNHDPQWRQK